MLRRNWLDLFEKLVDRFDMDYTIAAFAQALGNQALSFFGEGVLATKVYANPYPITLSGGSLSGSIAEGIAYDPNGQIIQNDSPFVSFTIPTANPINPRWDILVLRYKLTGDTPVPKPSAPLVTIFLNLHDDFDLVVIPGIPDPSPVYPAKFPEDVILAGIQVPNTALVGTDCTIDLSIRENAGISIDPTNLEISKQNTIQQEFESLDSFLQQGDSTVSDDGKIHDSVNVTCLNGGTNGDSLTVAGVTFTIGSVGGPIVEPNAKEMAFQIARFIRENSILAPDYTACASDDRVAIIAKNSGAIGGAISTIGTTFSLSGASLSGNGSRVKLTAPTVKQQLDQIDQNIAGFLISKWTLEDAVILFTNINGPLYAAGALTLSQINIAMFNSGLTGSTTIRINQYRGSSTPLATATAALSSSSGNPYGASIALSSTLNILIGDILTCDVIGVAGGAPESLVVSF